MTGYTAEVVKNAEQVFGDSKYTSQRLQREQFTTDLFDYTVTTDSGSDKLHRDHLANHAVSTHFQYDQGINGRPDLLRSGGSVAIDFDGARGVVYADTQNWGEVDQYNIGASIVTAPEIHDKFVATDAYNAELLYRTSSNDNRVVKNDTQTINVDPFTIVTNTRQETTSSNEKQDIGLFAQYQQVFRGQEVAGDYDRMLVARNHDIFASFVVSSEEQKQTDAIDVTTTVNNVAADDVSARIVAKSKSTDVNFRGGYAHEYVSDSLFGKDGVYRIGGQLAVNVGRADVSVNDGTNRINNDNGSGAVAGSVEWEIPITSDLTFISEDGLQYKTGEDNSIDYAGTKGLAWRGDFGEYGVNAAAQVNYGTDQGVSVDALVSFPNHQRTTHKQVTTMRNLRFEQTRSEFNTNFAPLAQNQKMNLVSNIVQDYQPSGLSDILAPAILMQYQADGNAGDGNLDIVASNKMYDGNVWNIPVDATVTTAMFNATGDNPTYALTGNINLGGSEGSLVNLTDELTIQNLNLSTGLKSQNGETGFNIGANIGMNYFSVRKA